MTIGGKDINGMEDSMKINSVADESFRPYGRILKDLEMTELLKAMESTPLPEDVIYVPSDEALENLSICKVMQESVYGGLPVQIGYCNGHNSLLNGLEYHRSSEVNVAVTDMILLLGRQQDIEEDYTYDTSNVEAFLIPKGTAVEVYATTLHYAPCGVEGDGFRCVVVLPKGTNYDIEQPKNTKEDRLLAASNKWLIAHEDAKIDGAFVGLKGINVSV